MTKDKLNELAQKRNEIYDIDEKLIELLNNRFQLVEKIAYLKNDLKINIHNPEVEQLIMNRVIAKDPTTKVYNTYCSIFHQSKDLQQKIIDKINNKPIINTRGKL